MDLHAGSPCIPSGDGVQNGGTNAHNNPYYLTDLDAGWGVAHMAIQLGMGLLSQRYGRADCAGGADSCLDWADIRSAGRAGGSPKGFPAHNLLGEVLPDTRLA